MRNLTTIIVGIIILLVLVCYMIFFQVSYDENAVVTTWENADPPVYNEAGELTDPGSLITEPGVRLRAPWPIQKVYHFSTKIQLLEQEFAQFQTADQFSVIVRAFATWRISDPYRFYVAHTTTDQAEDKLSKQMQDLLGIISNYNFDQLVNVDPNRLALDEIEEEWTRRLQSEMQRLNYGIEIEQVGIRRLILPESTTEKVFERMRTTRELLASIAEQEGENRGTAIRADAERIKEQILAFAENEANNILAEAKKSQAEQFDLFNANPELAIFLRKVDTLRQTLPGSTLVLDAAELEFLDLLRAQSENSEQPAPSQQESQP
jgi:membrane protease subunit HflC